MWWDLVLLRFEFKSTQEVEGTLNLKETRLVIAFGMIWKMGTNSNTTSRTTDNSF